MGKDRSGVFHPGKGKPSGINKEEGLGLQPTNPEDINEYNEIAEKYIEGEDKLSPLVHLRHPNRNTSKGEENYKGKANEPESDKTISQISTEDKMPVVAEQLPGSLTKDIFKDLALYESPCCVSVYIKTHNAGVEVNEHKDTISLKNALQKAETLFKEKNIQAKAIQTMLQPGYELLRNDAFWLQQSPGLALFIAEGHFKYIKMPFAPDEYFRVEDTFYVTPLIPAMITSEYFYLLVISKKQCKLFRADAFNIHPVDVKDLPNGLAEELGDTGVTTTFRTGGRGGTGGANFHGLGGGNNNDDKAYIANYLKAVDDAVWKQMLHDEKAPLLLAGVEYLLPIYRSVSAYQHIWDDAMTGSHEYDDLPSLYQQALEKMEPYFQQRVQRALENYRNLVATPLTSSIRVDIIPAAYYGRIAQLFVVKGEHVWGKFNEMESQITYLNKDDEGAQDLIDNTVVKTLLNGGEVFLLDRAKMPAGNSLAAIFRY